MSFIKRKVAVRPVVHGPRVNVIGASGGCCCSVPARFLEVAAGKQESRAGHVSKEVQKAPDTIASLSYGIPLGLVYPDRTLLDLGLRYFR